MKKKKQKTVSKTKDEAWKEFSKYIRLRDCLETTKSFYEGRCITCGKLFNFKQLQAGHFVPGRTNAILFNEDCVHAQCYRCNISLSGNLIEYYPYMLNKYGKKKVEKLKKLSRQIVQFKVVDLERIKEYYKDKYNNLLKQCVNHY